MIATRGLRTTAVNSLFAAFLLYIEALPELIGTEIQRYYGRRAAPQRARRGFGTVLVGTLKSPASPFSSFAGSTVSLTCFFVLSKVAIVLTSKRCQFALPFPMKGNSSDLNDLP